MTSDDVAPTCLPLYSVEDGMTPKQTIEKMSSTQQYSSVIRQVVYKWHRRFSMQREESGAKKGQPMKLNKRILQTLPYVTGATGDVRKILIIRPLIYRISCNFNSMSRNKLPTGFIQIKLISGLNFYDKMHLYDR